MAFDKDGIWITSPGLGPGLGPPPKRIGISPLDIERAYNRALQMDVKALQTKLSATEYKAKRWERLAKRYLDTGQKWQSLLEGVRETSLRYLKEKQAAERELKKLVTWLNKK